MRAETRSIRRLLHTLSWRPRAATAGCRQSGRLLGWSMVLLLPAARPLTVAAETIHVRPSGSQASNGSADAPFQLVASGLCKSRPGDEILIEAGAYPEMPRIATPVTLASTNGTVSIGRDTASAQTTLSVLTYNTHLFGDTLLEFETFADNARAAAFAQELQTEQADVVALEEVWDEDLAAVIQSQSGYPFSFYADQLDDIDDHLNSGLLLLSRFPIDAAREESFNDEASTFLCALCFSISCAPLLVLPNPDAAAVLLCYSCLADCGDYIDGFASKGFVEATIDTQDGFQCGVFFTHLQTRYADIKAAQLAQMSASIRNYRANHPNNEIFVMGDFNINSFDNTNTNGYVNSYGANYVGIVLPVLGLDDTSSNGHDAFRNAPCFYNPERDPDPFTIDHENNQLHQIFGEPGTPTLIDYVFYSLGTAYNVSPDAATIRKYQASPPIEEDGQSAADLSDHFGLFAHFTLRRP